MLTKANEPIYQLPDGTYVVRSPYGEYGVCRDGANLLYTVEEVEDYLSEHPDALVDAPCMPAPTAEALRQQEIQSIENELKILDEVIPRSVEDLYKAWNMAPHPKVLSAMEAKDRLRAQLHTLLGSTT